ncbi:CoA transferase [Streptomyces sp. NPDC056660]|uniref:CoA transferase n=1 Tax=Streptomyces sp. NPDC056660 TaxID=3345897 RepID=UPI00367F15B5
MTLDLKDDSEHAQAVQLIHTADVLITNMRPRTLARLGLTYEDLAAANVVYAAITTALYRRERRGQGANVGTSPLATGVWWPAPSPKATAGMGLTAAVIPVAAIR